MSSRGPKGQVRGNGDSYDSAELVPGVVALMDPLVMEKNMLEHVNVPVYSCEDAKAARGPHSFMCVHRSTESGRTYWAPLENKPEGREMIDGDRLRGAPNFVSDCHNFATNQLWVCDDDTVNRAVVGRDFSRRGGRNQVVPPFTLEDFTSAVQKWVKQADRPKKEEVVKAERDPTNANALFKLWAKDQLGAQNATMQKEQKAVKSDILTTYPGLDGFLNEDLLRDEETKKALDVMVVPTSNLVNLLVRLNTNNARDVIFFQHYGGPWLPTLQTLHRYPWMMKRHQVDIGGCKFVISGADVVCPGVTKVPGGMVGDNVSPGDPVAIYIEGKQHAAAVGLALMSSAEIKEKNHGRCVTTIHYIGDGLWKNAVL